MSQWIFRPGLVPGIASVVTAALLAGLGVWQLHRADEKSALQTRIEARARLAPLDLNAAAAQRGDMVGLQWRHVDMSGAWEGSRQILLDNQVADGRVGYFVFTPFRLAGCACAVLVNRGWIAIGASRSASPDIRIDAGSTRVNGIAAPIPASGLWLGGEIDASLSPGLFRVQRLDLAELSRALGFELLPITVRLDPVAPDGYRRAWRPPDTNSSRHVAYAVQWFLLAFLSLALFAGLNWRRA